MIKVDLFTIKGEKKGKLSLPDQIFGVKINPVILSQAVRVYLANQRKARAKVKSRGEVSGSGIKIWRQKGTGRARHGSRYVPIFVGGGVAHGPTGQENYHLKLTKKVKRQALFSALSAKLEKGEVFLLEALEKIEPKTKKMVALLEKIVGKNKKILIVLPKKMENVSRAAGNLAQVKLSLAGLLNPYEVLNGGKLIFTPESITVLEETFLKKEEKPKKQKPGGKKHGT